MIDLPNPYVRMDWQLEVKCRDRLRCQPEVLVLAGEWDRIIHPGRRLSCCDHIWKSASEEDWGVQMDLPSKVKVSVSEEF